MSSQPRAAPARARSPRRWWRKPLIALCSVIVFFVVVEFAARVASYLYYDRNPYYLWYGFRSWSTDVDEGHSEKLDGYFKFPASCVMQHGVPEPARINNHGFRGADFEPEKPAHTFRVIALGESSTFGYTNRDAGTYPRLLEQEFAARGGGKSLRVEVINCGIPHANSANISALFEKEVVGYQPDLITLYFGYNDAAYPLAETAAARVSRVIDEHSAAWAGVRKVVNELGWAALESRWSPYRDGMDLAAVERQLALHLAMTERNLRSILDLARARGIRVLLIRQPMTVWFEFKKRGLEPPRERPTYAQEYARIAEELRTHGRIHGFEARLFIHRALMDLVVELAAEYRVPLIDNAALVDEDVAAYLATAVHLTEAANQRLARALHQTILPLLP